MIYLAERDSLTGLYNRHRFQIELERTLAESARRDSLAALLYSTSMNSRRSTTTSAIPPATPC
jgi:GGDEF domain-containing protein